MEIEGKIKLGNNATEIRAFDLAASALQDAGFKQALIFATRLGHAGDMKKIDKSDPKELEKYGLRVFQAMDTVTMLASIGSHIKQLIKEHPEDKPKVAYFVMRLIDDVLDDDKETMN